MTVAKYLGVFRRSPVSSKVWLAGRYYETNRLMRYFEWQRQTLETVQPCGKSKITLYR